MSRVRFSRTPRAPAVRRAIRQLCAAAVLLGAGACGSEPTGSNPPPPPPRTRLMAIGDTVVDTLATVRLWYFDYPAGAELNVFVQALTSEPSDVARGFVVWIVDTTGGSYHSSPIVAATGDDSALELNASGRFTLPRAGRYGLQASWGTGAPAYTGPFRLWIYRINRAPEHADSELVGGDTISTEAIDHVGDLDDYHYTAAPGEWFNLLVRVDPHSYLNALTATVPDLDVGVRAVGNELGVGPDTALSVHATGRFQDVVGGSRHVEVAGESDRSIYNRGPYQLLLARINLAPETAPSDLVPGDSVTTESIDPLGDVDEYHVSLPGPDSVLVNAVITRVVPNPIDGLGIALTDQPGVANFPDGINTPVVEHGTGDIWVHPGHTDLVVVSGYSAFKGYQGPYRLHIYAIDPAPETAPALIAIGDTISEALDPLGDIDTFQFDATVGDQLIVFAQGTGTDTAGSFAFAVTVPGTDTPLASGAAPVSAPTLAGQSSGRFTIPTTGRFALTFSPDNGGTLAADRGPYRFLVAHVSTAPETHTDHFSVGDSVTDEAIDYQGDVDEFRLQGAPGQSTIVLFQSFDASAFVDLVDPVTQLPSATIESSGFEQSSGLVALPATGELVLRVYGTAGFTGGYRLVAAPNTAGPETISAQVAIGDTVSGEELKPAGDVDEFQFTATAGRQLTVQFQTPLGITGPGIVLEAVVPATDSVLSAVTSQGPTANLEDQETGAFTIPQDGTYVIRVRSLDPRDGTTYQSGGYRFRIVALN